MTVRLYASLIAVALLLGCSDKKSDAEQDRTLLKLKEAQAKGDEGTGPPAPNETPNQKLADIATGGKAEGGPRPLPAKSEPVRLGTVSLRLTGVETMQTVSSGKISVSTERLFVAVKLLAENTQDRDQPVDFSMAALLAKGEEFPIARDVQRVAGTRELSQTFGPDKELQKMEVVLLFEVPPGAVGSGMTLRIKSPELDPVTLPLE